MKKILVAFFLFSVIFSFAAIKVGFIYIGPVGDSGWTYAHDLGRQYLVKDLGSEVQTFYKENVPEGAEAESVLRSLINLGCKVIFATSFGYMDATLNVAQQYPNIVFEHCSGYKTAKNVGTYFGRIYQPSFLAGMVAGAMTKTNKIGYVAPIPIPEVIRITNAFALGVRFVNPKAKIHVVWVNAWYDPASEKEASISLLDLGCDVLASQQDSPAPLQAAEERGAYSVGYNNDMRKFAPKGYLTAPIWNWGVFYSKVVKEVENGTWKTSEYWGGLDDKVVKLAKFGNAVPPQTRRLVNMLEKDIEDGTFHVFSGPIYDQNGNLKVKSGTVLSDQKLLSMDWFVSNIEGKIPSSK
jgi:basic membrane protein A